MNRHDKNFQENSPGSYPPHNTESNERRTKFNRLIPIAIFAGVAVFIAYKEIPVFQNVIERVVAPDRAMAGHACRSRALSLGQAQDYARIVKAGLVNKTQNGYFVEKIIIGEMSEQGGEVRFTVDCYTDENGNIVRADLRN